MGDYTTEPYRKDCVLHLSFDTTREGESLDLSPQKNDGIVVGSPEKRVGAIGEGLFLDENSYIEHNNPITTTHQDTFTFVTFVEMEERPGGAKEQSFVKHGGDTHANLRYNGTKFEFAVETSKDGWVRAKGVTPSYGEQYLLVGIYDNKDVQLYVDDTLVATETTTDSPKSGGSGYIGTFDTSSQDSNAVVDEPRIYRRVLSESEIGGILEIANEHRSRNKLLDVWDNPGIPLRGNNLTFSGTLAEEKDAVRRQVDFIREARHIGDASGQQLDEIGSLAGIKRKEDEADNRYRARIIAVLVAGRSEGTFDDIIYGVATILDTTIDRIEIDKAWQRSPSSVATALIYVRREDLDNSALTTSDLTTVLKDIVFAGHDIEVRAQGSTPFLLIDDTQVSNPENGLTADGISTGGGLSSG